MKWNIKRHDVVLAVLAAVLAGLMVRHGLMLHRCAGGQTDEAAQLARQVEAAAQGRRIVLPTPARPGDIYARSRRSHVLLAGSRQTPSCFVDPKLIPHEDLGRVSAELAGALDLDPGWVYRELSLKKDRRFLWIARGISHQQAQAVRELHHRAAGIQYEWRRDYPNGPLAGTVLGYCRRDGQPGCGLELKAHNLLAPTDGRRVLLGDAWRRPIWTDRDASVRPRDGQTLCLSLDVVIQGYLQEAVAKAVRDYGARWGTGVVVNPWTGDVLAMCSSPEFDPNEYSTTRPENMLNRAIACPFEPGSVFKPVIAAAAVDRGLMNYETRIDCENGVYNAYKGGRISDHGQHYGLMSLAEILVKSSNIGMAKVGEKMGNRNLYKALHRWGFGEKTGIPLPGESGGIVRPAARWDGYSLRRVPFGQEIAASSLQLAMAFSAFANGGLLMKPRLIEQTTDAKGQVAKTFPPSVVRRVLSEGTARRTLDVLGEVVRTGTGKKSQLDRWESWGKTGTAQIPGPKGYIDDAYVGSFIGGAPLEHPAVVCLISIYWPDRSKGYYGGTVAAPAFKEVLEKTLTYLHVPPDRPTGTFAARGCE
ncbi:MAG: penicillin-binding protein 2 [Phycisphaerae bacterium]|nr:penicillin-binding protein 2 [Phycisphaerae bacterium]